jgi:hypothetical protein
MFNLLPGKVNILEGVITQGRSDSDNWVTEYTVSYSSNKRHWFHMLKGREHVVRTSQYTRKNAQVVTGLQTSSQAVDKLCSHCLFLVVVTSLEQTVNNL